MTKKLILASQSPQRKELMLQAGLEFSVIPANINERINTNEKATAYVKRMSLEKAKKIHIDNNDSYIISADTVISTGRGIFGKPKDVDDAYAMLKSLSGRSHNVRTGLCVISPSGKIVNRVVSSKVKFKHLNDGEIKQYLMLNQWQDKAGAYGIQSMAGIFIRQIIGSYSNIVGLPLHELYNSLKGLGYNEFLKNSL